MSQVVTSIHLASSTRLHASSRVPRHLVWAKALQPQNCLPAIGPLRAWRMTIGVLHSGQLGKESASGFDAIADAGAADGRTAACARMALCNAWPLMTCTSQPAANLRASSVKSPEVTRTPPGTRLAAITPYRSRRGFTPTRNARQCLPNDHVGRAILAATGQDDINSLAGLRNVVLNGNARVVRNIHVIQDLRHELQRGLPGSDLRGRDAPSQFLGKDCLDQLLNVRVTKLMQELRFSCWVNNHLKFDFFEEERVSR